MISNRMLIPNRQLLICVHDSASILKIETAATELGIRLITGSSPESLLDHDDLPLIDAVIVQFSQFGPDASFFIDSFRAKAPDVPLIALLRNVSPMEAVRFSRTDIFECLDTLSTTDDIYSVLESAHSQTARKRVARGASSLEPWRRHLVGESRSMEEVTKIIRLVASRRCTVLISGETGTGKEMAARAIHLASDRARRPMISVNCSAIPENLMEAELFGHVKGAFTGAINHRTGRFEQAHGSTLFLDEIADLPFELQAKLLRVLQEREVQRLGSGETIKIDVRVIAATNANLLARVQQGRFREDLYYRLNVVPIHVPALRERVSDLPLLAEHFIGKVCEAEGLSAKKMSPEAVRLLSSYSWPGNVRQLENIIEHAVVMSGERDNLNAADFSLPKSSQPQSGASIHVPAGRVPDEGLDYTEALRQFERVILEQALTKAQGNKTLAADMLRLPRTTLIHKLRVLEHVSQPSQVLN